MVSKNSKDEEKRNRMPVL